MEEGPGMVVCAGRWRLQRRPSPAPTRAHPSRQRPHHHPTLLHRGGGL